MLGTLASNGGPTQTVALLAGSPALDGGSGAATTDTDQRGVPRGHVLDIGAYQATATQLDVAGFPSPTAPGASHTFTVSAVDPFGQPSLDFNGPVTFSSSDPSATLPTGQSLVGGQGTLQRHPQHPRRPVDHRLGRRPQRLADRHHRQRHPRDRELPQAGHDDAGELDRHLRLAGLRHRLRALQPAFLRHRHAQRPVDLYLDHHLLRPPRLAGPRLVQPHRRRLVLRHQLHRQREPGRRPAHDLELYFLDWDNKGRSEQVQISDAGTGTVLDTETISSFTSGVYLDWKVSGNLVITITRQAGRNAVLNGVFLDSTPTPTPTATARFLKQDTTTQGSWIGTYGAQGYDIVCRP